MTDAVFWSAVQGIGTVIAALAAIIALIIAGSQLRQLIASNRLLAASNDTMAESNIALTRPYVVIDYEFRPAVMRRGGTSGTSVFVTIRNDGRTPGTQHQDDRRPSIRPCLRTRPGGLAQEPRGPEPDDGREHGAALSYVHSPAEVLPR